jgi:hypothetical protein
MDDEERNGLLQYIRELERTTRRWKAITALALAVLALFLLVFAIGLGTAGLQITTRVREERTRAMEVERAYQAQVDALKAAKAEGTLAVLGNSKAEQVDQNATQEQADGPKPGKQ